MMSYFTKAASEASAQVTVKAQERVTRDTHALCMCMPATLLNGPCVRSAQVEPECSTTHFNLHVSFSYSRNSYLVSSTSAKNWCSIHYSRNLRVSKCYIAEILLKKNVTRKINCRYSNNTFSATVCLSIGH